MIHREMIARFLWRYTFCHIDGRNEIFFAKYLVHNRSQIVYFVIIYAI